MRLSLFISFIVVVFHYSFSQELKLKGEGVVSNSHLLYESDTGDSIYFFKGYVSKYSSVLKLVWVTFYKLTPGQLMSEGKIPAKRINAYRPYELNNGELTATNYDYKGSGYDRGHMVPAGDFFWDKEQKDETFSYLNINPYNPQLNRGIWAGLENAIRRKVSDLNKDAYVITGIVINPNDEIYFGPNNIRVPNAYYKAIYFPDIDIMYAFFFDNTVNGYYGDLYDFQVSIDFIELVTQEDFFDKLDNEYEEKLESQIVPMNSKQ